MSTRRGFLAFLCGLPLARHLQQKPPKAGQVFFVRKLVKAGKREIHLLPDERICPGVPPVSFEALESFFKRPE